jgi:hypothetical protein
MEALVCLLIQYTFSERNQIPSGPDHSLPQFVIRAQERNSRQLKRIIAQVLGNIIYDIFAGDDPGKQNILEGRIGEKIIQEMIDVVQKHLFVRFNEVQRIHHHAPVAVQPDAIRKFFIQFLADTRFADSHGAVDHDKFLHLLSPPYG